MAAVRVHFTSDARLMSDVLQLADADPSLFAQLSEAAAHHADPELCSHLHLYRDGEPLAHWFDAFDDPFMVSKVIPHDRVESFCLDSGGVLADGAA